MISFIKIILFFNILSISVAQENEEIEMIEPIKDESKSSETEVKIIESKPQSDQSQTMFPKNKLDEFFSNKSRISEPFKLRDPFRVQASKVQKDKNKKSSGIRGEVFTNIKSVENVSIDKLKIVGILVGKDRRAMAQVEGSKDTVILKEGMELGDKEKAIVKAILPGGIVLVEKIINVYGQDEYLETIIPLNEN